MKKIIFFILFACSFSFADTIQVIKPGDTLIVKQPSVVLNQSQFQQVVSDKQTLKTDSTIVVQQSKIISNYQTKDSLMIANNALQDSITNKYRSEYEIASKNEAKLQDTPWYKSDFLWAIFGAALFYFAAIALHNIPSN
jgi:hypothetical protein